MWTTKEGLMKWWAPSAKEMGFDFTVKHLDVRPGGTFAFGMKNAQHDLVNKGTYRVVEAPRGAALAGAAPPSQAAGKLAWTWHFDIYLKPDEKPYDVPIEVTLTPTPMRGTQMVFKQGPLHARGHTEGSRKGVLQNFDHLARALESEP